MGTKMNVLSRGTSNVSVQEAIRSAIFSGEITPGSQLKQSNIAEKLGVSQGPVREALGRLVEEGLVDMIPYHGMFVRKLSQRDVNEIYLVRTVLEVLALRLAFEKLRNTENRKTLQDLFTRAVDTAKHNDTEGAVAADLWFHRFLVEVTDNSHLIKMWDSLLAQARYILTRLYALDNGSNVIGLVLNHEKLLESIYEGNLDEAIRLLEGHLEFARKTLIEKWEGVTMD